ncbi:MAG: Intracellular septation protein IspA [Olavius algarvensis Gamma 3 endosymbiont]|nr:MAG: Intracellular septation protein IspA [Olavius algarvensis Gamma 3 endosymbiont]
MLCNRKTRMKQLLDFFPILLFFILYKFYLDLPDELILAINDGVPLMRLTPGEASDAIYLATLAAILVTLIQVVLAALIVKKVEKMPLITLAILIVFGGATLAFKDPLFIQWKPTAINWLFALVFFGSHFVGKKPLIERMMGHAIEIQEARVWVQLNLAWVAFFVVAGIANLIVAPEIDPLGLQFSEDTWVDFKLFGLMGMTIAFVVAQAFYLARYMPNTDEETS